jgi:hypothetical protein
MISDSDDLEQQLRENLKLRRELAAEVAKAKGGGIAYRLTAEHDQEATRGKVALGALA